MKTFGWNIASIVTGNRRTLQFLAAMAAVPLLSASALNADDVSRALKAHLAEPDGADQSLDDDDVDEEPDRFRRVSHRQTASAPEPTRRPVMSQDGPGFLGQAGHLAFKTFGRDDSISPIEAMPYVLTDEHFVFSDLRGFVSNDALFGGNFGIGYRHLREDLNSWFGVSGWFDVDGTSGKNFQQFGLSFEAFVDRFELRSNVYLPITDDHVYSSTVGNERIVGNQLFYSRYVDQGTALNGVDLEAGYNLPVKDIHQLRGYVGYYHFQGGPSGGINGFKTRLEGVINNSVTAQVMYTTDELYGNNVMVGCTITFPWGSSHPASKWKGNVPSPFRFVERNYNVIVDRGVMVTDGLLAYNPLTNRAYNIRQVSTGAAAGGNGTFANPYATVAAAQSAGADVILVQGNSVLTSGVTLAAGQQLLGDGSNQSLALLGGGSARLPTQVTGGATPRFEGVNGPAVTLGSQSTVAGFRIVNNNGNGIVGSNVNGATIRDMTFQGITGDAMRITNSSGKFDIGNLVINQATGNGISFTGGAPDLTISGSITGTQADGIVLSNLTGGSVSIANTTINQAGGTGLRFNNVGADAFVDSLTAIQTGGAGIAIAGGSASDTYRFRNTKIENPGASGVNINNTPAAVTFENLSIDSTASAAAISATNSAGKITLTGLDVDTQNAVGLYGRNLSSLLVNTGVITTKNAGGIDVQDSTINMALNSVSVDGGPFGIRLMQNTGKFTLLGGDTYASAGTIKNTSTGVIINKTGTVDLNWLDLTSNGVGIQSTGNTQVALETTRITGSSGYAIDSMNDLLLIIQTSTFDNNGGIGGGTIRAQANVVGQYQWLVEGNLITDHNGTPILMQTQNSANGASLGTTVRLNTINANRAGSTLVNINWFGPLSVGVANNALNAGADNMTGIAVRSLSTTDSVIARINNNAVKFAGTQGTGVLATAVAGSSFQVDSNDIIFNGTGGTGLRFNLGGVSSDWIFSNKITDNAGGATGMLFDAVAANSRVQIEANQIKLLATDLSVRRGIIFSSVTPTIQFASNVTNIIENASIDFSIPVNAATGSLLINGVPRN